MTARTGRGSVPGFALEARPFRLAVAARRLVAWIGHCHERHRQRIALADLDEYRLRDIGVTRDEAEREAGKPFWRD